MLQGAGSGEQESDTHPLRVWSGRAGLDDWQPQAPGVCDTINTINQQSCCCFIKTLLNIDWEVFFDFLECQQDMNIEVDNLKKMGKQMAKFTEYEIPRPIIFGISLENKSLPWLFFLSVI